MTRRAKRAAAVLTTLLVAAPLGVGCSRAGAGERTLTVLAAASLTDSFTDLAAEFERTHPGVHVRLSFGGSTELAAQVAAGAPADVLAAASAPSMDTVVRAGLAGTPRTFARNGMTIAVPPGNPAGVAGVPDLARPGLAVALCQPQVPCGAAARRVLDSAHAQVRPRTEEADVRAVLTKVELGEVDAGLVYVTDAAAARGKVTAVPVPAEQNASTEYPITVVGSAREPELAREFVDLVTGRDGQAVLARAGFTPAS